MMVLHLLVLARACGFELTTQDAKEALKQMTGETHGNTYRRQRLEALKCLTHGEAWPLNLKCSDGHQLDYSTPNFFGTLSKKKADVECQNCSAKVNKYYTCPK